MREDSPPVSPIPFLLNQFQGKEWELVVCQGSVMACSLGMFIVYCYTWEGEEGTIKVQTDQVKKECDVIDAGKERENSLLFFFFVSGNLWK